MMVLPDGDEFAALTKPLDVIECPTCGLRHPAGRRFVSLPTVTIDGMVWAGMKDMARRWVVMSWLNRDAVVLKLRADLATTTVDATSERRKVHDLSQQLSELTKERNLYRALVQHLGLDEDE